MKKWEVLGNSSASETGTLCYVLGEFVTLGAARREANRQMLLAMQNQREGEPVKWTSVDVDDGRGNVAYTATPESVLVKEGV